MKADHDAEGLFEQYADMVYRVALSQVKNPQTAQDAVQEVFLRYLRKKPQLTSDEHKKAWLIRVTVNCCKSMHTSAWVRNTCPLEDDTGQNALSPAGSTFHTEDAREFYELLLELPPKYRVILYLRYYEEYQIREIADILHITPNLASVRLKRAKKILKQKMSEDEEEFGDEEYV